MSMSGGLPRSGRRGIGWFRLWVELPAALDGEALALHEDVDKKECAARTADMLRLVGFPEPKKALRTYPFELSGGLRQRAMIALALAWYADLYPRATDT